MFLRTAFNYDVDAASFEAGLACADFSRTKQSFKEECDINTIVDRFGLGYEMPEGVQAPMFADVSEVPDFRGVMDLVKQAGDSFLALPADVRSRFANDPAAFVSFCSDDANADEVDRLGLMLPDASRRRLELRQAEEAVRIEKLVAERLKAGLPPS